jgi:hypothetical protein
MDTESNIKLNDKLMKTLLVLSLLVSATAMNAQTNNSPYSIIGIGDIEDNYFNRTSGLSNTGIAYRSNRNLINNNPASFSALDNQFFAGEIGIRGKYTGYYGTPIVATTNSSSDIAFKRFVIGTKVTKHLGTSAGLVPYSSESYEFNSLQPIQGTGAETANAYSQGFGGLNRVYLANSYDFFNHLSLGVDASYLFGSISQKTILQNAISYISTNKSTIYSNFYFNYGLQYYGKLNKKWDFVLGATFANKTDLYSQYSIIILAADSSQLYNQPQPQSNFSLPTSYGVGLSLTKNKKYTFVADYKYQGWSALNYSGYHYTLQNSNRISAGFEISKKKNIYNNLYETSYFQTGLYYGNSYLNVYGQQITDMGATVGFGVNSKRSGLGYTFTLQYGIKGSQSNGLIQERYGNLTIMVSYRDLWYTKGKVFY